jgi:hypothetical protein
MLKTRNFIGMDVRLLPANEATTKSSFTVKKAVIGGLLICIVIAIGVLCINRRTPGTEKETFTEFHCKFSRTLVVNTRFGSYDFMYN